jgi:hypothetical protein
LLAIVCTLGLKAADCLSFEVAPPSGRDCSASFETTNLGPLGTQVTLKVTSATSTENYVRVKFLGFSESGAPTFLRHTQYYYGGGIGADIHSYLTVNPCGSVRSIWQTEVDYFHSIALIIDVIHRVYDSKGKFVREDVIGSARVDGTRSH